MNELIEAFKAAGEATRLRALRLLLDADRDLCACEIIEVLQKPQYTISKSLGALVAAGLVEERREGRKMMYSLLRGPRNEAIFDAIRSLSPEAGSELAMDRERFEGCFAQAGQVGCDSIC
jgi:ArsR family transcriptional regulator, arsenate/arsenite/antimonite-responsive transcriptional repressor